MLELIGKCFLFVIRAIVLICIAWVVGSFIRAGMYDDEEDEE